MAEIFLYIYLSFRTIDAGSQYDLASKHPDKFLQGISIIEPDKTFNIACHGLVVITDDSLIVVSKKREHKHDFKLNWNEVNSIDSYSSGLGYSKIILQTQKGKFGIRTNSPMKLLEECARFTSVEWRPRGCGKNKKQ